MIVSSSTCRQRVLAELLPGVEVHASEQGLVVEHLLEVRHHPERVDRVARESARRGGRTCRPTPSHRARSPRRCEPRRRRCARRRASTARASSPDGNFGARPNPPHSGSNCEPICCSAALSTSVPGSVCPSAVASFDMRLSDSVTCPACSRSSARRSRHASVIAASRCRSCALRVVGAAEERFDRRAS